MPRMHPIARKALRWYAHHRRAFPWRGIADPYRIWVSETMLQQTQVETVIPYYKRFVRRWRTVRALASARLDDVLKLWEGMGYYARARNLHRGAQVVVRDFAGSLPPDAATLRTIPGIGRYTAGAIASLAFRRDEPVVDANIQRVVARLFLVRADVRSGKGQAAIWEHAGSILPHGRAGDFNQALMDLGSSLCTPRKPACHRCPLRADCRAYAAGVQERLPLKRVRKALRHHDLAVPVVFRRGRVLIAQRKPDGLLGGLWEFVGIRIGAGESARAGCRRAARAELGVTVRVGEPLATVKHAFSHFSVTLHFFRCEYVSGEPQARNAARLRWAHPGELDRFAWSAAHRRIIETLRASAKRDARTAVRRR